MADIFGLFFARQFMLEIPDELLEAARLDGAGEFTIFTRVVVPLAKPAIAVLVILGFSARWNAFAWPLVALTRQEMYTVQLGINYMRGYYFTDFPRHIDGGYFYRSNLDHVPPSSAFHRSIARNWHQVEKIAGHAAQNWYCGCFSVIFVVSVK